MEYRSIDHMTDADCERHIKVADPKAYVECCTGRIYGTHNGLPMLLAGNWDWKRALENLATKTPRLTAFGYYLLESPSDAPDAQPVPSRFTDPAYLKAERSVARSQRSIRRNVR